ncbi:MAG: hypothetical protein QM270_10340 [Bacillota bacterium]|nr:hypothetical protein [Bacillota bacterium]
MFPRTTVGGLSLSRMIIGTNWMLGFSHRSVSQDQMIRDRYSRAESFQPILDAYMEYGIDTIMGPISQNQIIIDGIRLFEERTGKKLILVDTPILNVDDTAAGRREAEAAIRASAQVGSAFCLIHHSSAEQLVNKNTHEIVRLGDYTDMIRQAGMRPGLSAHMPELIVYSDEQGYDVETYIQIYNCMGFLMQVEIETVAAIIRNAKKPVMTIKSMAAGRVTPFVGLTFSWNTIRERDMITLGAYSPDEVHEDVEISLAAIEHRFPQLERRSSPAPDQAAFGD